MMDWDTYRREAKTRGALALELYVVLSLPVEGGTSPETVLADHLEYQRRLEGEGRLVQAGPLSDESGQLLSGAGLIVYRANSLEEARELAEADPMHSSGARSYSLRRWLWNEGRLTLDVGLSTQSVTVS
ncbi:YciI family protein [uncultured Roseibium sp.]|uniref:YciI family protein n=1 Tax=uncultured Roseibium sp. TaxID=1936171 RepID=UPI00260A53B1|nr:YciI family protein [uncultured Roseibium sp.]